MRPSSQDMHKAIFSALSRADLANCPETDINIKMSIALDTLKELDLLTVYNYTVENEEVLIYFQTFRLLNSYGVFREPIKSLDKNLLPMYELHVE